MFITFEGGEGTGKSTQIELISQYLQNCGRQYLLTREPGGTKIGRSIRSILLNSNTKALDPKAELLLYAADKVQHIETVIKPALQSGKIVLCDRFADSTVAYQGYARELNMDLIENINKIVLDNLKPDITFLLDLLPEVGLSRAFSRIKDHAANKINDDVNINKYDDESRFEREELDFHKRIRKGFLKIAKMEPNRFIIIDASKDKFKINSEITAHIRAHKKIN